MTHRKRTRREFTRDVAAGAATLIGLNSWRQHAYAVKPSVSALSLATFSADVTVPIGHPLCANYCPPATKIVDPLSAHGVVLLPEKGKPVVLFAVDWCWLRGAAYDRWREALAEAAHTTPQRVAVHCVHQHGAPLADPDADRVIEKTSLEAKTVWTETLDQCITACAKAAREGIAQRRRVTHVGMGQAEVEKVASNRRIIGPDGKIAMWRGSSCGDPKVRAEPVGLIDPWLKCLVFYEEDRPLASLQYYATHPMSYYRDGGVSSDFCGLARRQLRKETGMHHIYFTGCAGDVAAGKYNDGSHERRLVLTERMHAGMRKAYDAALQYREPVRSIAWKNVPVSLPMRDDFTREYFRAQMLNEELTPKARMTGALGMTWWDRHDAGKTIDIAALHLNEARIVHLPGESLIRYQMYAQEIAAEKSKRSGEKPFVCTAAYGDLGPSYIPTARAYDEGGYEVDMSFVGPGAEAVMKDAMSRVLRS